MMVKINKTLNLNKKTNNIVVDIEAQKCIQVRKIPLLKSIFIKGHKGSFLRMCSHVKRKC